jgi:hypothetical protein
MRLQGNITAESIVNTIKQQKHKGSLLFVEGQSDYDFWIKFKHTSCKIHVTFGFPKLFEVIELLEKENYEKKYVGIIDADFRHLDNEIPKSDAIFLTDKHDLEVMLINSQALNRVIDFYCKEDKNQKLKDDFIAKQQMTIKELLIDLVLPIAYFKKVKQEQGYSFKFKPSPIDKKEKDLEYTKFIDKVKMAFLGYDKLIDAIKNYTERYISKEDKTKMTKISDDLDIDNQLLIKQIKEIESRNLANLQLCNGHDLTNILAVLLMKAIANYDSKTIPSQEIESKLVAYYDSSDLQKTNLYHSLKQWENTNGSYKLLKI